MRRRKEFLTRKPLSKRISITHDVSRAAAALRVAMRSPLPFPCVPDRPYKILLVQVGTLSFSHPSLPLACPFYLFIYSSFSRWISFGRVVVRIGVIRATEACFLTADRQCTELPLLRLPRLVPEVARG